MFGTRRNDIKTGLSVAALALLAACPAEAQFNNGFNPFSIAPRALQPLGNGPLLTFGNGFNNAFGNSFGTGFTNNFPATFGNTFNSGAFNNSAFSTSAFNNGASFANNNGAPFFGNQFNGNSNVNGFTNLNGVPVPTNGFNQPVAQFNPLTGAVQSVDPGLFFQANPSFSPFVVNGTTNGSFGTFNNANATPQRVFRAAPPYNPTIPNRPASAYPQVATAAELQAMSSSSGNTSGNGFVPYRQITGYGPYWPNPRLDATNTVAPGNSAYMYNGNNQVTTGSGVAPGYIPYRQITGFGPYWPNPRLDSRPMGTMVYGQGATSSQYQWPTQPPPQQYPQYAYALGGPQHQWPTQPPPQRYPQYAYALGGPGQIAASPGAIVAPRMGFQRAGAAMTSGVSSGTVVFGGRR